MNKCWIQLFMNKYKNEWISVGYYAKAYVAYITNANKKLTLSDTLNNNKMKLNTQNKLNEFELIELFNYCQVSSPNFLLNLPLCT